MAEAQLEEFGILSVRHGVSIEATVAILDFIKRVELGAAEEARDRVRRALAEHNGPGISG